MERRLAAILAADVVGYSRLIGRDEAGTLAALKALRRELIEPLVASHRGRIVKQLGDGFLVEFASVVDAVSAALAWQRGLAARGECDGDVGGAGRGPLAFRIGVNLGDVVIDEGDLHGDGVNIAARLEALAPPGGVCIADMVHQNIGGRVDAAFEDLGEVALKNIDQKVRVWRWSGAGGSAPGAGAGEAASVPVPDEPSIAVLPFDDMSNDPEQAFFCDGITEDLITELAHVPGLTVIARHSSFAYKARSLDARRIGAELAVGHLVEGSVRRAGERVRITAQLIDTRSGRHLWAQRYDRDVGDIFAVQDDVVRQIAGALSAALARPELQAPESAHPRNLEAYQYVVRGRQNILRAQGRGEVKEALETAIALDPGLSDAHAWLAVYYYTDWFLYQREPRRESLAAGFAAADTAIETGPGNSLAHMALGMVSLYAGRRAIALQSLHRALELNPNEADALCLIQDAYTFDGRPEEGVESVRKAMRLNPHYPEWYLWHLGFGLYCTRDYEGAVQELSRLRDIAEPLRILAAAHARLGQMDEARAVARRFLTAFPDFSGAAWGRTQPFRHREDLEHVLEGYRLAGLPD